MGKENVNLGSRYHIVNDIESLAIVEELLKGVNQMSFSGELEIEPFEEFSLPFQAEYWYLKYNLLLYGQVKFEKGDFINLFKEHGINVIWLSVECEKLFRLQCKDGNWVLALLDPNRNLANILANYELVLYDVR